ncbi:MAG: translation initiation factor IF-2 [Dethiobacter sp.]|jgi:translation initiation factor IF-2|nr:MAG: translation initiation factor IF-2 [Dethiobacter sp.]
MGKVRVYELSKELGINSKKLITVLQELNVDVKNHMSTMEENVAQKVLNMLTKGEKKPINEESAAEEAKIETAVAEKTPVETVPVKKKKNSKRFIRESRKARKTARLSGQEKGTPEESLFLEGRITVGELAARLNVMPSKILAKLLDLGIIYNINQQLTEDILEILSEEYGIKFKIKVDPNEEVLQNLMEQADEDSTAQKLRPPVVTVLGHVDHGKTSLLDAIRETNVIASEAGGITQHIGAYTAEINGKRVVFLDTPGHEAFTAMRARGAQVTDIAVLVVAADDGVMPQTIEAINHAKAAGVPIIVALNKIDKANANPERVKKQLADVGLLPEEWGGNTIFVNVSALKKEGLEEILEMILLVAEMAELKANYSREARGIVIEAKLDKGRGPVATMLVQDGVIGIGDPVICGNIYGKVRAMVDDKGFRIKKAYPSTPVEVVGLTEVPQAGDNFMVVKDEKLAKQIAQKRGEKLREATLRKEQKISLDDFFNQIKDNEIDLNIIIKADVQGSAEALHESMMKIESEKIKIKIIHKGVGAITESDVMLASASNAIIIGYNIRPEVNARKLAERERVDIRLYRVIYEIIDDVKAAIHGLLEPEYEEMILGQAEVRQIFKVSRVGTVAGTYVLEGKINRNASMRVIRDGVVIHEGKIDSLKRFKDDTREVSTGFECGILLENFNDLKEGDIMEAYEMRKVSS